VGDLGERRGTEDHLSQGEGGGGAAGEGGRLNRGGPVVPGGRGRGGWIVEWGRGRSLAGGAYRGSRATPTAGFWSGGGANGGGGLGGLPVGFGALCGRSGE